MGCYDSALLRPLLSRSSSQSNQNNAVDSNNTTNNNNKTRNKRNSNDNGAASSFSFRRRRPGYEGMENEFDDNDESDCSVDYSDKSGGGRGRGRKTRESFFNLKSIMDSARKVGLLLWKNLLLRRRHYIVTALEIILPTLFALILVYGRNQATKGSSSSSPSAGLSGGGNDGGLGLPKLKLSNPIIFPEIDAESLKISCPNAYQFEEKCVVAYAPQNAWTDGIIARVKSFTNSPKIEWEGFPSEGQIELRLASSNLNASESGMSSFPLRAAIIFDKKGSSVDYKIRMMDTGYNFPREVMQSIVPWLQLPGPDYSNRYGGSGFTAFQVNLDKALIMDLTNSPSPLSLSIQEFPYPPFEMTINFSDFYFLLLPNVLVVGFIFIVPSVIRGVVSERETGIKELMRMSGMPNWMHWLAWMMNSMLFLTISVTIVVVLFCSSILNHDAGPIIAHGSPAIWWIVLMLYVLSSTAFLFFISSFFQRPTIAITVGIILWLATFYAPSVPLGDNNKYLNLNLFDKMSVALLPNMALYWALKVMCAFEGRATGAQFSNIFKPLSSVDEMTLGHVLFMFLFDTVLYLLLTLYVEAVLPSNFGIRKPWYFIFRPFQPSYWKDRRVSVSFENEAELVQSKESDKEGFETEPDGLKVGVEIRNMKKQFGRNKVAVAGVSVKMYDGEIFALLGHNGAGKTTTISCCIGMISPTNGTAVINGYDIRTDIDQVRQHLGLCPQHNLIFDELTVSEHLIFFARMKGLSASEAKDDCNEMLRKLQLTEKANTLAKAISGGQKRKLCLGISLIGRAKVVFLDEPTSGMDVEARRAIWDLLLKERGQRTIILTTHFMEEADVLGDRIGIMANGQLQCVGTSLFLKKFYGTGYTLSLSTTDGSSCGEILQLVQSVLPNAAIKEEPLENTSHCEWSIVIPSESCTTADFPEMFRKLQENKVSMGIKNIGLSLTTMDEVFVKAGEASESVESQYSGDVSRSDEMVNLADASQAKIYGNKIMDGDQNGMKEERLLGIKLLQQQFVGLVVKRYSYTLRKWVLFLTQLAIPVLILILAISASNTRLQAPTPVKALGISLAPYKNPISLYYSTDNTLADAVKVVVGPSAALFTPFNETDSLVNELLRIGEEDLAAFRERHIVAAEVNSTHFKAMYSSIPYHASPLSINLASNTILRYMNKPDVKITVTNHPIHEGFDYIFQALEPEPAFSVTNALMFGALTPIGLALLAASYIVAPVEEKLCNGKQLQFMTGVNPITYWGSSFVWDYFVMALVIVAMTICFPVFQTDGAYTSYGGGGVIFLILLTYGYSAIPFSYLCSLVVGTVPGGFSLVVIVHIATGMMIPFVVYVLEASQELLFIADQIRNFARLFPTFGASMNTMRFIEIALKNSRCNFLPDNFEELLCNSKTNLDLKYRQCCHNCLSEFPDASCFKSVPYISWTYQRSSLAGGSGSEVPGIGQELIYMFLLGILYQVLLIIFEYGLIKRVLGMIFQTKNTAFQNGTDDEDVLLESERVTELVRTGRTNEDALIIDNFCKSYGSFAAVSNLSFGVHHGECFGLLGVNGAGKTTTFRMLTGDELRSNGNAYSTACNLDSSRKQFLGNLGYCPQFDGLIGVLTGREMVSLFGRLRGVKSISEESRKWLQRVGLTESADVQCRKYSGGMKRRLSAAMAMIGDPEVVLLDEPTSGVDPISRREFWKIISSIKASGRAIILTSHSMDEIAACCSRLGIMVNGQMQCLGTVQHLKTKYAQGYTLAIKLKSNIPEESQNDLERLEKLIITKFSPCTLKDKHKTALQYHIQNAAFPWDILFQVMEDLKIEFPTIIEEYSITETSLEEVFLAFARMQYPPRLADIPTWKKCVTCQFC